MRRRQRRASACACEHDHHQGGSADRPRKKTRRHAHVERLEIRAMMTASFGDDGLLSGGVCSCPVCTGVGLSTLLEQTEQSGPAGGGGDETGGPQQTLPVLSSRPGATAKLFLDFDGNFLASWGGYTNVTTPAYDTDGNVGSFSAAEITAITQIWQRVAEDYAPFNIDVTTIDPGNRTDKVTAHIAIGGNYSDWYQSSAGGVAYVGGFYNFSSNTGFVFEDALGGSAKNIAEAASHEAGHLFGLSHQAQWSGTTLVSSYHPGSGGWAPIMGVGYSQERTTWHDGATSASSTSYQYDLTILSNANNAFGWVADDYGNTTATASNLPTSGSSVNFAGLIGNNDQDVWSFNSAGGAVSFVLNVAQYGPNLDAVLELLDAAGNAVVTANPAGSLGASISTTIGAGTFYLVARSSGGYGNMGQYTITGTLPAGASAPEIAVQVNGSAVADGGTVNFGSTNAGTSVTRTFTVTNTGNATLTLTSLSQANMPAGYTLVTNLGSTSLAAGASTTFSVRLDAGAAGTFNGSFSLANNDANENPYDFSLTGVVNAVNPEIHVLLSGTGIADGGAVNYGSTTVGTIVTRTFTVRNDGNATLTLTSLSQANMPAGFTLTSNLGSTSLAPGATTTFSVCFDAAAVGTFGGTISLVNNDSDENPYDLVLSATATAAPAPEIHVLISGTGIADGGSVNYGSTTVGTTVTRTFTVRNDGNATLTLTSLSAGSMPAGFTLVTNLGSTSLAPGATTTFSIRFNAASAGTFGGTINLANNDGDENPYNITLSATANAPVTNPEISVLVGSTNLTSGQTVDFGTTTVGTAVTRTITVRNDGNGTLTLTAINPSSLPAGYSLVSNLGSTSLAPGASTTFVIRLDASATGSPSGTLNLASNDANENPFALQLSGTVDAAPTLVKRIVDNGATGHTLTGSWTKKTGQGFESDIHTASKGSGSKQSNWLFSGLPNGQYNVWVTYTASSSNASNAPFSFYTGTGTAPVVQINQKNAPTTSADGAKWTFLKTITVNNGWAQVRLTDKANGTVVADAVRLVQLSSAAPTPEIAVLVDGSAVADGGTVSFGSTNVGTAVTRTFTVRNDGDATLTLTSLSQANMPAGFTLVSGLGSTSLAAGATTTFSVRFDAGAAGTFGGTFSLASNDGDEGSYDLTLSATAQVAQTLEKRIIDNGASGHKVTGSWTQKSGQGFENDLQTASKGNGSTQSDWTFSNLPSGQYNVWVTYTTSSSNASNAPFSFYTGTGTAPVVQINQKNAPTNSTDGAKWTFLKTITVENGWAMVRLTNKANGTVVADAIRLVQLGAAAPAAAAFVTPLVVQGTAPNWAALAALASSGRDANHGEPDALPLPAGETTPAVQQSAAHEQVWSQPDDVAAELSVLAQATELLASLRLARNGQSEDDWAGIGELDGQTDWLALAGT